MVPALLLLAGKRFGVSTSFQHIDAMCAPNSRLPYLRNYNWRGNSWRLVFIAGIILGAYIANQFLSTTPVEFLPDVYYTWPGLLRLALGGLLVGFGVRYADGCTSGHTIMGISSLHWPSLVASISFFVGGLIMVHLLGV
jgi:hypothetical protein